MVWNANPKGLDVQSLIAFKGGNQTVADFPSGERLGRDAFVGFDGDIWIPAARPDVITLSSW
jgi:glutamate dehydrogenase/leucine dehydrogenase